MLLPNRADLEEIGIAVRTDSDEEPWIVSAEVLADDGDKVVVTWDEIQRSVFISWVTPSAPRLTIDRDRIDEITISEHPGQIVRIYIRQSDETRQSELVMTVGASVHLSEVSQHF